MKPYKTYTELAKIVGVKLSPRCPEHALRDMNRRNGRDPFADHAPHPALAAWNGFTISTGSRDDWSVYHDIAHWMICPPERRRLFDYGLGPDPEDTFCAVPRIVPSSEAEIEEFNASVLDLMLQRFAGEDWRYGYVERGWDSGPNTGSENLGWLVRHGFVAENLDPIWPPAPDGNRRPEAAFNRLLKEVSRR